MSATTALTVLDEFNHNINQLRQEGMVDIRAHIISRPMTDETIGVIITINNVLRLRREGKFAPCVIN